MVLTCQKIGLHILLTNGKKDTLFNFKISSITNHWAYQTIFSYGYFALPSIFKYMQKEPDLWFTALRIITGDNPIPCETKGYVSKMTNRWLEHAKEYGYII